MSNDTRKIAHNLNSSKKVSSMQRTLEIYRRLMQGEVLEISLLMNEFQCTAKTIKGDFRNIRDMIEGFNQSVVYDSKENHYALQVGTHDVNSMLTSAEAIVILMLLYQSRVLNEKELNIVREKLLKLFSPQERHRLERLFRGYQVYYKPIITDKVLNEVDKVYRAIVQEHHLKFDYYRLDGNTRERVVIPYSIALHNGFFYLFASTYNHIEDLPVAWRFDRIDNLTIQRPTSDTPKPNFNMDIGEHINRAIHLFSGEVVQVRLKLKHELLDYLKRITSANYEIVQQRDGEGMIIVELETSGTKGIEHWIMAQGEHVEVLAPDRLREQIQDRIRKMCELYHMTISKGNS